MSSWREFIEDADGRGSAARLNMIIGVVIGSFVIIWMTIAGTLGWEIFATYMGSTGGIYGMSKWRESAKDIEQIRADSPNPQPSPTTIITSPPETKDVNIKAQGDVNVSSKKVRK